MLLFLTGIWGRSFSRLWVCMWGGSLAVQLRVLWFGSEKLFLLKMKLLSSERGSVSETLQMFCLLLSFASQLSLLDGF